MRTRALLLPALLLLGGCVRNNYVVIVPQVARPVVAADPACARPADTPPIVPTGELIVRRKLEVSPAVKQARTNGCASVLFRIDPSGKPTDIRLVRESPPGSGYGEAMLTAMQDFRYGPSPTNGGWHFLEVTSVFPPRPPAVLAPFRPVPLTPAPSAGNPFRT